MRRALEETALTTIYLATFTHWMRDESENSQRTRDFLAHKLALGEKLDRIVYGAPRKETPSDSAADTQSSQSRPATIDTLSSTEPIVHQMRAKSG